MGHTSPPAPPAVRIDADNEWAWCGEQRLPLTPRAFAVLRHLVEHPQRLITKDDLLNAVWRDTIVSDAALASCIRDLRKALGDASDTPRYIETVHRRGYRFIGPTAAPASPPSAPDHAAPAPMSSTPAPTVVGREAELARLLRSWERATGGQRQFVFVTGEPGIGKTALVEAFLAEIDRGHAPRIGRGECVQQYGAGEAYLPVLAALARLGRETGDRQLIAILRQYAPTWLAQLPSLLADTDLEAVQRRAQGATRERMQRELVEALEALTVDAPLVLLLEDLHWSDSATIDLLAMLARRPEAARLLVLATYRPADVAVSQHPLTAAKRELELHGRCEDIALTFLGVDDVAEYLSRRFARHEWPSELAPALYRRTDGNPLFLVNTVDDLIGQGQLHEVDGRWDLAVAVKDLALDAPATLSQMVDKQIERLTADEQAMLTIASVAGVEFSSAVATANGIPVQEGDRRCEALARRGQFLRATGIAEWPDGTVAGRYAFIHALYQHVLYARLPFGHRVGLHLRTGERLEAGYGERAGEIAGELAMHFAEGRDVARAARYHHQAGDIALRQHGYREAADHVTRALESLRALADSPERAQQELTLQVMLGSALTALKGLAAHEVEQAYARARELCERVDDTPRLFPVLLALGWFYFVRGLQDAGRDVGRRLLAMAETSGDAAIFLAAHHALGVASFYGGEFETTLSHLDRGIELYDPVAHSSRSSAFRLNIDAGMSCLGHAAWALWALGYPTRALARMQEALAVTDSIDHPFSAALGHRFAAGFYLSMRQPETMHDHAERSLAIATEHGFSFVVMSSNFHRGWLLAKRGREEDGLALMRAWMAACQQIRTECVLPTYRAWLAEMYGTLGRPQEGLDLVEEALAAAKQSGNHYWTAELYRVRGTLARTEEDAESSFLEAMAIARRQQAKSFELRAAASLSRLWARRGKAPEARALLTRVYGWFAEGFDTPDLTDARALLAELGAAAK